jgi:DNA mismatch endonuclease (patch repair protein)
MASSLMPPDRSELEARYRSSTMAAVKGSRTDLEQLLAGEMWAAGLRGWRRGRRTESARPDFVFVSPRVAVFVDGCFWHGCPACAERPATNRDYWDPKIERNQWRDREQTVTLEAAGWTVLRFWGHDVETDPACCAQEVALSVTQGPRSTTPRTP